MKLLKMIVWVCLLTVLLYPQKSNTPQNDQEIRKKLDRLMGEFLEKSQTPGFSIGILKNDKTFYLRGFGVRSLDTKKPVTPQSLFHMASVSKPFVATAIMQLAEKGKINLDDKLITRLPYFKIDDERYREITIQQMLSHVSGMPDVLDYEWDKPQYDDGAAERYIRSLTKEKLIGPPGKQFKYSNMAFDILADVIARASGITFEDYIKQNILNPLEMTHSTFLKREVPQNLATAPHVGSTQNGYRLSVSPVYPYHRAHAPSSTLHSNASEMLNWARANLNRGSFKNSKILDPSSYDLLWKPYWKERPGQSVGLSWFINEYRGYRAINHSGGDVGYRSHFVMFPELSVAIVVMGNGNYFRSVAVARAALDIMLGFEPPSVKRNLFIELRKTYAEQGLTATLEQYKTLKKTQDNEWGFSENVLNNLGYWLLNSKKTACAIAVFKLNVAEYPESWNVYDSLGEAYMKAGVKRKAIANYKKSLELNPANTSGIKMLKKLKGEK